MIKNLLYTLGLFLAFSCNTKQKETKVNPDSSSTNEREQLNWAFVNDNLILTEFVPQIVNRFGKKTPTDNFVLGKKKIELKMIEKKLSTHNTGTIRDECQS